MFRVGVLLSAVALATVLVPTALAQDGAPSVRIASPNDGVTLQTSVLVLDIDVSDFELVAPDLDAGDADDRGHLRVTVDGAPIRGVHEDGADTVAEKVLVTGLRPGAHVVRVELRSPDGEALEPRAYDEINVTVAPAAPYIAFREGKPWPGQLTGSTLRAEVAVERAPAALPTDRTDVQWSLDGNVVATGPETWHEYQNVMQGVHRLRAELLHNGKPLSPRVYDEILVGVPDLDFTAEAPTDVVAGKDFAPAVVPFDLELDGASLTDHRVRVLVDGEPAGELTTLAGEAEVPLGTHVVAVELVRKDGASLDPPVGDAWLVEVAAPPPEVRIASPGPFETVPTRFRATAEVSNLTLVPPGEGAGDPTKGHLVWYLDGAKVAEGPELSQRFSDLGLGLHTIAVHLVSSDGEELATAEHQVNVDAVPVDEAEGGANVKESPAPAAWAAALAAAAALARRRR